MLLDPIFVFVFLLSFLLINGAPIEHVRLAKKADIDTNALYHGIGTYYSVAGIGSCGDSDTDDELVVAVNKPQMKNGADPNQNPECGKYVEIEGDDGEKTTARIVDTCPTCDQQNLDMSPKVFEAVCGDLGKGKCNIKWRFQDN